MCLEKSLRSRVRRVRRRRNNCRVYRTPDNNIVIGRRRARRSKRFARKTRRPRIFYLVSVLLLGFFLFFYVYAHTHNNHDRTAMGDFRRDSRFPLRRVC